jgi:AcrR family transcriptional regulator
MGRPKVYDKDAVLTATTQLFWKKGLAETSLADIEKSTGVNKSSLYAEFTDKDDIFVASLIHYIKSNGVYEILGQLPLGKSNIIEFLRVGKSCPGQRGCFAVNSLRESAILPAKAKEVISTHLQKVKSKLAANIQATNFTGSAEHCAELILTFNAGLCLELNANKNCQEYKIQEFIKLMNL